LLSSVLLAYVFADTAESPEYIFRWLAKLSREAGLRDNPRQIEKLFNTTSVLRDGLPPPLRERLYGFYDRVREFDYNVTREIRDEMRKIHENVYENKGRLDAFAEYVTTRMQAITDQTHALQADTHSFLAIQGLGVPTGSIKMTRFLPVRVYIDDTPDGAVEDLTSALTELLSAYDFEIADEFPAIKGSWFQKLIARTKEALSEPEVATRLAKVERALEIQKISKPQAEADDKHASAMAKLVKALDKTRNGVMQAGSVLVVKTTPPKGSPVIMARTLTQAEMIAIENNQMILQNPAELWSKLADACAVAKVIPHTYIQPSSEGSYIPPTQPPSLPPSNGR